MEEEWETIRRKIREQDDADSIRRALRIKNLDLLPQAIGHLHTLISAGNSNDLSGWANKWDAATAFIEFCKREGLI